MRAAARRKSFHAHQIDVPWVAMSASSPIPCACVCGGGAVTANGCGGGGDWANVADCGRADFEDPPRLPPVSAAANSVTSVLTSVSASPPRPPSRGEAFQGAKMELKSQSGKCFLYGHKRPLLTFELVRLWSVDLAFRLQSPAKIAFPSRLRD